MQLSFDFKYLATFKFLLVLLTLFPILAFAGGSGLAHLEFNIFYMLLLIIALGVICIWLLELILKFIFKKLNTDDDC